jgi:hypothetical protein
LRRWFPLLLVALLVPGIFGGLVALRKDFYNELWAPASLLVHGRSPYDTASLETPLPAVWLPMAIGTFAPLGWLSEATATHFWFFLNVSAVAAIVYLALRDSPISYGVAPAALLAYFFPPTLNHFLLGQFSIPAALCMMLAARFMNQRRQWPAAFLLAVGLSKPQLGILAALGLGYFVLRNSGVRAAAGFGLKVMTAALTLSLPVLLVGPGWLQDFVDGWQRNPPWQQPSSLHWLQVAVSTWGVLIWVALAVGGLLICFSLWRRLASEPAMYWTLGLTALLSPYVWSWDFVLLLPLWLWTLARVHWKRQVFLVVAYLLAWAGMAYIQLTAAGGNQLLWWVPVWFLGTILLVTLGPKNGDASASP